MRTGVKQFGWAVPALLFVLIPLALIAGIWLNSLLPPFPPHLPPAEVQALQERNARDEQDRQDRKARDQQLKKTKDRARTAAVPRG